MKIRKIAAVAVLVLSSFAASNVAPSKAELEAMYDKAFREFDANNFPEALKQLDAIDARQPDLAESQNLRGVIFMREGLYDKAEAALHEALRIDSKFWNARFNLAEIPFLKKDWVEARNRFQDLLSNNISDLQGEAAQLIQYKILLTYLLEGKENMVDSILAKFELSPETPAVHYANAAIALQHNNTKEAKDWIAAAEKSFSPQLNKLFAESLYEVGWLPKQAGQARAALEISSPQERAAKAKAFAKSRFDQAQQAFQQRDLDTARRFIEEADAMDPNQAPILTLKGEVLMEQKDFDGAEAAFKKAAKLDPKFREAQYNLAQIPFKKKDYSKARERFEGLFSQTPGGDKNQAAQMIKFKIFMTFLLEGKDSRAQKMMEQFQFTGDTPALYYAQAAWEFKHNNPVKANDWIASAKKIYSASLNHVFAESFYDLGWLQSPVMAGSPVPSTEAAAVVASAQTESSPAIEPSPIPDASAAGKQGPAATGGETAGSATTSLATSSVAPAKTTANESVAAGSPAMPSDIPALTAPSLSPTVETPVAAASPAASVIASAGADERNVPKAAATAPLTDRTASPAAKAPTFAGTSATPATALAPSRITDASRPSLGQTVGAVVTDWRVLLVAGLLALAVAGFFLLPDLRRRMGNVQVNQPPVPATGPRLAHTNGNGSANGNGNRSRLPNGNRNGNGKMRLAGGPRQVSLQLKASEPSLRRSVRPVGKTGRFVPAGPATSPSAAPIPVWAAPATAAAAAAAATPVIERPAPVAEPELVEPGPSSSEPEHDFAIDSSSEPVVESVGPIMEQPLAASFTDAVMESEPTELTQAPEFEAPTMPEVEPAAMEEGEAPVTAEDEAPVMPEAEAPVMAEAEAPVMAEAEAPVMQEAEAPVMQEGEAPVVQEAEAPVMSEGEARVVQEHEPSVMPEWAPVLHTNGETPELSKSVADASLTNESSDATPSEPMPLTEFEPVAQGQPVPYQMPVSFDDGALTETAPADFAPSRRGDVVQPSRFVTDAPPLEAANLEEPPLIISPYSSPSGIVSTEPSILQPTTSEIMPEPIQIPTAPVIRTPSPGGAPHSPQPASAMQTAVQLTFSFEIASMQLTPTFKMGALQLRPTSRIVTMRLAPSQAPQPAMNLQVTFEISKIQPSGGGLGQVRLTPSQQQRPSISGSPSFTVGGLQLISNFEAAPVQLTPSQQASVFVTGAFQIATVEFSPTFDIASIVLNASSKQVAVQLAGTGSIETAPMFEIANLQLGASGEIGIMQLNLLGQGARRAA
jgi:tetratricopeptide (TPR) repeat protein